MTLVTDTIRHLDDVRNHIAIIKLADIEDEYGNVFQFLADLREKPSGAGFTGRFAAPDENPNGQGEEVVLVADPTKIIEAQNSGGMVFIVRDMMLLKQALRRQYIV